MTTTKQIDDLLGQINIDAQGHTATFHIDERIFLNTVVSSTCACLSNIYFFNLCMGEYKNGGNPLLILTMERKDGKELTEVEAKGFLNELFVQKTRFELQAQFGRLRDRIVDYAFAPLEKGDA